jgi:hypothetical protein
MNHSEVVEMLYAYKHMEERMDGHSVSQMLCRDANASRNAAKIYSGTILQHKRSKRYFIINYVINCIQQSYS